MASADGPIKTFPLRGIKDTPPYLHDGRLLTLDDVVEFFNLIQGLKLTDEREDRLWSHSCGSCNRSRNYSNHGDRSTVAAGSSYCRRHTILTLR